MGAFPHWIVIADTAASKRDSAFIHFSFYLLIESGHAIEDAGQRGLPTFRTFPWFLRPFDSG